ncbi:hypothetical protein NDA01_27625 [Trichocoleus desertorum AS-A10]|uniref:hypothetical protein n=1 Tax=Trichocoleus desertorum TaxID=1481672 RepID=UPI003296BACB
MADGELQHSILYLPPYEGESISHYLGRWFRQEAVSLSDSFSLSRKLKLGSVLWRWQHFYFNPSNHDLLLKISTLTEVEVDRLLQMFPPEREPIKPKPIRLCAACYVEAPYHCMGW